MATNCADPGDLRNRGFAAKDVALKETTVRKPRIALRNVKARVDTRWKKLPPLGTAGASPRTTKRISAFWRLVFSPKTIYNNVKAKGSSKEKPLIELGIASTKPVMSSKESVDDTRKEPEVGKEVALLSNELQAVKDTDVSGYIAEEAQVNPVNMNQGTLAIPQIRQLESVIYKAIEYKLYPVDAKVRQDFFMMSKYFLERALVDKRLASYRPLDIAGASLFLSLHLLDKAYLAGLGLKDEPWTLPPSFYLEHSDHMRPITRQIAKLAMAKDTCQVDQARVRRKLFTFPRVIALAHLIWIFYVMFFHRYSD